ncbi:MAG: peroxiredoxin [Pseudomonadota bacterium]
MILLQRALDFTAQAVMGDNSIKDITLSDYFANQYGLLIFYPFDFTFICPTELLEFNNALSQFEKLNCKILFISIDSVYSHLAWKQQSVDQGGVQGIKIPMVSDVKRSIVEQYNIAHSDGSAFRATFLIDTNFIVRSMQVNDMPLGRNINEYLRLVNALQHHVKYGNVCPANWNKGSLDLHPSKEGVIDYFKNKK